MTAYPAQRIRRSLEEAVERVDPEDITSWLMMFTAGQPIRLHHPRMGKIAVTAVTFYGSVVDVYDRYVLLVINDLVTETTQTVENLLEGLARQDRAPAVREMTDATGPPEQGS